MYPTITDRWGQKFSIYFLQFLLPKLWRWNALKVREPLIYCLGTLRLHFCPRGVSMGGLDYKGTPQMQWGSKKMQSFSRTSPNSKWDAIKLQWRFGPHNMWSQLNMPLPFFSYSFLALGVRKIYSRRWQSNDRHTLWWEYSTEWKRISPLNSSCGIAKDWSLS